MIKWLQKFLFALRCGQMRKHLIIFEKLYYET